MRYSAEILKRISLKCIRHKPHDLVIPPELSEGNVNGASPAPGSGVFGRADPPERRSTATPNFPGSRGSTPFGRADSPFAGPFPSGNTPRGSTPKLTSFPSGSFSEDRLERSSSGQWERGGELPSKGFQRSGSRSDFGRDR